MYENQDEIFPDILILSQWNIITPWIIDSTPFSVLGGILRKKVKAQVKRHNIHLQYYYRN